MRRTSGRRRRVGLCVLMGASAVLVVAIGVSCRGGESELSLAAVEGAFSSNGIELIEAVSPVTQGGCLRGVLVPRNSAGDNLDVSVLCSESAAEALFHRVAGDARTHAKIDDSHVFQVKNVYIHYRSNDELSLKDVEKAIGELA